MLSPIATEHVQRPRNAGPFEGSTHVGTSGTPGEGPYAKIHVMLHDGRIERAHYETNGCPSAMAAASVLCSLIRGRDLTQARLIEPEDLLRILGGLPEGKEGAALRAIEALRNALVNEP